MEETLKKTEDVTQPDGIIIPDSATEKPIIPKAVLDPISDMLTRLVNVDTAGFRAKSLEYYDLLASLNEGNPPPRIVYILDDQSDLISEFPDGPNDSFEEIMMDIAEQV